MIWMEIFFLISNKWILGMKQFRYFYNYIYIYDAHLPYLFEMNACKHFYLFFSRSFLLYQLIQSDSNFSYNFHILQTTCISISEELIFLITSKRPSKSFFLKSLSVIIEPGFICKWIFFLEHNFDLVICGLAKGLSKHSQNGDSFVHIFAYFEG